MQSTRRLPVRLLAVFLVTWGTASALLLWNCDFTAYVELDTYHRLVTIRPKLPERVLISGALGLGHATLTTGILYVVGLIEDLRRLRR